MMVVMEGNQLPSSASPSKLQISEHSTRQYCRVRNPCLKTTSGRLTFRGPSPGDPSPPRMQVVTHLMVHASDFLDLGRWILGFLQSSAAAHSPDSRGGMFDRVSSVAAVDSTAAAASSPIAAGCPTLRVLQLIGVPPHPHITDELFPQSRRSFIPSISLSAQWNCSAFYLLVFALLVWRRVFDL
ncbi:hypothetical protein Nepgr_008511 [Nepenthes gracilis]|uniref:Uncharacterized protein n=1 Tax=Nepenthes gracilis TaxID=150966 RepID=A0AAD3S971_NEPGR|nr:hypothetical protein Nepgr_008511 [Nepenthes gracilis]